MLRHVTVAITVVLLVGVGSSSRAHARAQGLPLVAAASCVSSVGPGIPAPAPPRGGLPGFHSAWFGQSGYPSLCAGGRSTATVAFLNTGSRGWTAGTMGEAAFLGTWDPDPGQDRASVLGGDGRAGSPSTGWPRHDRVAEQPAPWVGPGQVAWFQFVVEAPRVPGIYRLSIRPLIEGATWLEDEGVFWVVTVLNPDGSLPTDRVSAAVRVPIDFHAFALTPAEYGNTALGEGGGVILTNGTSGTWTSPWRTPPAAFTRLIPSWNAETPAGTSIEVEAQVRAGSRETRWWRMGRWAADDADVQRTSFRGQEDADGRVATDTLQLSAPTTAYRLRVTLLRATGSFQTPVVRLVAAVVSDGAGTPGSAAAGVVAELAVPRYSQEIHAGEYPQYSGGGEAWCSPTSTEMVVEYWGRRPSAADLAWIAPTIVDPAVDHAARSTYDAAYRGTGNWPFNAAYAARYGLRAFVTQLRSLAEAERFIDAGIPLVASLSWRAGELPGFYLGLGSNGHLLVVTGFSPTGDVIVNDPAAASNPEVRRVYPRLAFERAWLGGSGGVVYVIHPPNVALPRSAGNW